MLSETFLSKVLSQHVVEEASVVRRVDQDPRIRVGGDDGIQGLSESGWVGVLSNLKR